MTQHEASADSRIAGGCALTLLTLIPATILIAVSPQAALLTVWAGATFLLWRYVRKINNHSPPPPDTPPENTKPQFTVIDDPTNPARAQVIWHREGTP